MFVHKKVDEVKHRIKPNFTYMFFDYVQHVQVEIGEIPPEGSAVIAILLLYHLEVYSSYKNITETKFTMYVSDYGPIDNQGTPEKA